MEQTQTTDQQEALINEMYGYASSLFNSGMKAEDVKATLIKQGLDETNATYIVTSFEQQIEYKDTTQAQKDMLYGALWCAGGTVLTIAHIGFIFWGAIVFGAIRFFRGVASYF